MITCRELIDFLMDYVDDDLAREQRQRFDEHLGACPECIDYVESYRTVVELGHQACQDSGPPPDMPEDLVTAILDARRAGDSGKP